MVLFSLSTAKQQSCVCYTPIFVTPTPTPIPIPAAVTPTSTQPQGSDQPIILIKA